MDSDEQKSLIGQRKWLIGEVARLSKEGSDLNDQNLAMQYRFDVQQINATLADALADALAD